MIRAATSRPDFLYNMFMFLKNGPRRLIHAGLSALVLLLTWLGVRALAQSSASSVWKIVGIAGAAGICLLVALSWLWPLLQRRDDSRTLSPFALLFLSYLLPILALAFPLWMASWLLREETPGLYTGSPWLLLLQGGILAMILLPRDLLSSLNVGPRETAWSHAVLAGSGLWLLGAFACSLVSRVLSEIGAPPSPPPAALMAVVALFSVLILPPAEEILFRKLLPESLETALVRFTPAVSRTMAWAGSAALFATLQLRPLLWLPAFLVGIGLSALAEHTGRMRECILAHMVINSLALLLNWTTIL